MDTRETMAFVEATLAADDAAAAAAPPSPDEDDTLSSTTRRRFHTTHHDGDLVFKAPAADPEPAAPVAFERLTEPVSLEDEDAPPEPAPRPPRRRRRPRTPPGRRPSRRPSRGAAPPSMEQPTTPSRAHVLPGDGIDFTEPITPVPTRGAPGTSRPPPRSTRRPSRAPRPTRRRSWTRPAARTSAALDEAPGQGTWYDETYSDLSPCRMIGMRSTRLPIEPSPRPRPS